jgi:murein L,D-transpeptidase YafK
MRGLAAALLMLVSAGATGSDTLPQADHIVIEKAERRLTLYAGERPVASFFVALGQEPVGPKRCQGDNRTPEGLYRVAGRKADSDFHRALRLSYPSEADIERARAQGCEPGGDIMIHGLKNEWSRKMGRRHLLRDWTLGCVAVTNEEIERIWQMVADGVTVEIRP